MYNILYLGTKPIGEKCFSILSNRKWTRFHIAAVCSNFEADNFWWKGNSAYLYAKERGIPFIGNEKKNNAAIKSTIQEQGINLILSVGHRWIIPEEFLQMVGYNAYNLHLAKLPDYKGNFTYSHAILNGEREYGVTLHRMVKDVDEGEIFQMPVFKIKDSDTAYSLYMKSLILGINIFDKLLMTLENNFPLTLQSPQGVGHFYDRHSLDGLRLISDINDSKEVDRKARAFYFPPFENAYFFKEGRKYYVQPELTGLQEEASL